MIKKLQIFITLLLLICYPQIKANSQNSLTNDFDIKGFHLDLRIQVMTPQALHNFAKELSEFGINTLVMEWEASYPYEKHAVISNKYAYTREEVKSFIEYCNSLGIDVIPLQQCFGHVEYILRNERYSALKEDRKDISQICPLETKGDSLLFSDLFKDMALLHTSKYFHIGGDETYLLGHCEKCSLKASQEGKSKLFVDYMKMICKILIGMGKTPVMWADILLKYPEAANELPKETIFIDWNYGWKNNYFGDIGALQKQGLVFWGSPAIRSHPDNWYITEWEKHFNNQRDFIPYARKAGYKGMVMTSWSTSGLYGFTWDVNYEVLDMKQIRNTYPLSGFRVLVASYAQALKQKEPLDPKAFVTKYAAERFGFTQSESEKFWETFTIPQELIGDGKPVKSQSIADLQKETHRIKEILYRLSPKRNKKEFEHFKLMIDLREFYLKFKELKAIYNSENFSRNESFVLISQLEDLIKQSKMLDKRFYKLQKSFLPSKEIEEQNEFRRMDLVNMYNRVVSMSK
ncbi:conserved exported hypothetical protein [uncultured Paludibacter sp.]|uniref:Glycoside hydrolase family 20 catalytic domain-containing protein n=1 Tax=uncultured Paludibacter sp. TaxID=497635 RepID=A0A653ALC1_9BACT|nr:conserved exported hypothetical protein [uncultured Paludibacter sp.]